MLPDVWLGRTDSQVSGERQVGIKSAVVLGIGKESMRCTLLFLSFGEEWQFSFTSSAQDWMTTRAWPLLVMAEEKVFYSRCRGHFSQRRLKESRLSMANRIGWTVRWEGEEQEKRKTRRDERRLESSKGAMRGPRTKRARLNGWGYIGNEMEGGVMLRVRDGKYWGARTLWEVLSILRAWRPASALIC